MVGLGVAALLLLGAIQAVPAQAQLITDTVCKTFHSFNGNAKVKICAEAVQHTDTDRTLAQTDVSPVSGYQRPNLVTVTVRQWSSATTGNWCSGRLPDCNGSGNVHADFTFLPNGTNTEALTPSEHHCLIHAEVVAYIAWPGGGTSSPIVNSHDMSTVQSGCV
jgi:hypothetical protein